MDTKEKKMTPEDILWVIGKQQFYKFYEGPFVEFIEGTDDAKTKEEILKEIESLFNF